MYDEQLECIRCGQMVFKGTVSDFESTLCQNCDEQDQQDYDRHQAKLNRDFERELLP